MSEMITDRPDSNTYYNYTDLNRVETKAEELAGLLTEAGYPVVSEFKKDWTVYDFPTDAQRRLDYEGANEIEKVLVTIEEMINDMKAAYRRCNTFKCGE